MRNKGKKLLALVAAIASLGATVSLAGCGEVTSYKGEKLTAGYDAAAAVESNGGFAVKKGDFVYFINGQQDYTADNTYGDVVKGALLRISVSDMESGNYDKAQIVVPSLFTTTNYNSGVYIYGNYVYYATPTTDKNLHGEVENSWVDFKRAKLDGTAAPEKQLFRLSSNSANYRFVEENEVVYCLYEESVDGVTNLKSYNTATGKTTVLVKGAKSSFYYDMKDLTNPNVYYTMAVSYDIDSDNATTAQYDQLYTVNAAATVTVDADKAAYTANGVTYDFDEKYLKDNDVDLSDYTAYPYVNLGTLVLDGVGKNSLDSMFNQEDAESTEITGYNYTVQRYENGGVYFTRKALTTAGSTDPNLYYLADADAKNGKSISNNDFEADGNPVDLVSKETTKASATALFGIEEGNHVYYYVDGDKIEKATVKEAETTVLTIARKTSGATLLKVEGDYVYYSGTGTNGKSLSRIKVTDDAEAYNPLLNNKEYQPQTLPLVDYSDSWYKPEFFGNVVLYPNAQNFGSGTVAYNYIYATRLDKIEENETKVEAYNEFLEDYSDSAASQNLIKYFFRTNLLVSADSKAEYDEEFFAEVEGKFQGENALAKESDIIAIVGRTNKDDKEAIETSWTEFLLQPEEEETTKEGLSAGAIWAIVIGSVIVVAAAVAIPTVIILKKKEAAKREAEATVNAYKRKKIDTTDDKSIDVYADENAAQANEETSEQASEEVGEESTEETAANEETNE